MDFRPRTYENLHADLATAIRTEMARRGLTYAATARLAGWQSNKRPTELSRYVAGDTRAFGIVAALRVADALGLSIALDVRTPDRARLAVAA